MRDLPRGTVTLLFTDIEGSTRLLHEHGDAYADVLAEHRRVLREAFRRHGGVEVDTQGDAFFYAFPRAADAVSAASAAQAALADGLVRVRIGVHTGEPVVTDEGYVGVDVHRAARIMSAGHGGQVLVSEATRRLVDSRFTLRDLGPQRLKDLTEPQHVFQLGDDEFPPLKTLNQTNLPVAASPLVGRETELAELVELVTNSARVVTVTGAGGSGKTRLALQAAAEVTDRFADGVLWVPLAGINDPELVLPSIAQVLGIKDGLEAELGPRQTLLLLDNFEHVMKAAPRLAGMLATAPNVRVLATSRAPLHIGGEHEYPLEPLAEDEAATLFIERARGSGRKLDRDATITAICARLDGLPLALELAAARTKVLTPSKLLERLDHALPLLIGGARDAPERQRTLRATIEWSYELLAEDEQRLFARLSVFPGTFALAAAETVCDADLDALSTLVDLNLIRVAGESRFLMLMTIREFARDLLESSSEARDVTSRHALYFLAEAEARRISGSVATAEALENLSADHDNFRTALSFFSERGEGERQLRLASALSGLWNTRGHLSEGRRWFRDVVQDERYNPALRAKGLAQTSYLAMRQGDVESGQAELEQALQLVSRAEEPELVGHILHGLGNFANWQRDFGRGNTLLAEAEELFRERGDTQRVLDVLSDRGYTAMCMGDYGLARRLYTEAATAERASGATYGLMQDVLNLAFVALFENRTSEATAHLRESLGLAVELADLAYSAYNLLGFAAVAANDRKFEQAARLLGASDTILASVGAALEPAEEHLHARTEAILRDRLGEETLASERDQGTSLTHDDAVSLALASVD